MKKKPHLKFYMNYIKKGKILRGLCSCKELDRSLLKLIEPTRDERIELMEQGFPGIYWGRESYYNDMYSFTPLRQNIVLLMAAMNNEL